MNDSLQEMMREATRLTRTGYLKEATDLIGRALRGSSTPVASTRPASPGTSPVIDGVVINRSIGDDAPAPANNPGSAKQAGADEGAFISGTHAHAGLTRNYKLYVPPQAAGRAPPLVVMLHGCTQDPDDFAAGTGMNALAREQGFFVLYPAQSQDGNAQRCWNWFARAHQQRGSGEPALLADLTKSVIAQHGLDRQRVYAAGLSAGGAMADIVAAAYPDIYAAVGIHSGLPRGSATNVSDAFAVMKSGDPATRATVVTADAAVPTIVFHGERDQTVNPKNAQRVIAQLLQGRATSPMHRPEVHSGVAPGGRAYTRASYATENGDTFAELWTVNGAGHAWSGGSSAGSYTDPRGPNATREMLRFFLEHPLRTP
jgi:poly(hydroxyalkanoate) depolymerase family esterase